MEGAAAATETLTPVFNEETGRYSGSFIMPDAPITVTAVFKSVWKELQAQINAGGAITLTQDAIAFEDDAALVVPSGTTVTLDLNGYDVERGLWYGDAVENGYVILNNGTLTITDSWGNGEITGDTVDGGSGWAIKTNGTVRLNGGTLTGSNLQYSSVYVSGGAIEVAGSPSIGMGVYLDDGRRITVTGLLGADANIPVILETMPDFGVPVVITSGLALGGEDAISHFNYATDDCSVALNDGGEAEARRLHNEWKALQRLINAAENGDTITLTEDITAQADDTHLVIPSGKNITLQMDGHTLDRGLSDKEPQSGGRVIMVYGTLTIDGNGVLTGGNISGSGGGGICVSGGTLNFRSGSITGNKASYGGGVDIQDRSTMNMSGGSISGNEGNSGVYINMEGTLNLSGGSITGNHNIGVYVSHGYHYDAENVNVYAANLNISGNPVLTGNTNGNVCLEYGEYAPVIQVTGNLTNDTPIGVFVKNIPDGGGSIVLTSGLSGHGDASDFVCDDTGYLVSLNAEGEAILVQSAVVTFAAGYENPTKAMDPVSLPPNADYELPPCGFTAPAGKAFKEWSVVIGSNAPVNKAPGETITVTADTTVTAVWEDAPWIAYNRLRLTGVLGLTYYVAMRKKILYQIAVIIAGFMIALLVIIETIISFSSTRLFAEAKEELLGRDLEATSEEVFLRRCIPALMDYCWEHIDEVSTDVVSDQVFLEAFKRFMPGLLERYGVKSYTYLEPSDFPDFSPEEQAVYAHSGIRGFSKRTGRLCHREVRSAGVWDGMAG